jgi:hypothetical protein
MPKKKLFLFALALTAAIAATVPSLIGRAENVAVSPPQSSVAELNLTKETKVLAQEEPQVLAIEVTPPGFNPSETIVSKGKFLLLLQNRTGRRDLNFWLSRENEGRIAESDPQRRDWKAHVHLNPGTYILGETDHPEWKCIIRVTN